MQKRVAQEFPGNELLRILHFPLRRESRQDGGKSTFLSQIPGNRFCEGQQDRLVLRHDVIAGDFYVGVSRQKIQSVLFLVTLDSYIDEVCSGDSFLTVNPKGVGGGSVTINFHRDRGLFV